MSNDVNSKDISYFGQLAILCGLTAAGFVLMMILSVIIWFMMAGQTIPLNPSDILQPKYYNEVMVLQCVSTLFLFFLPTYFFGKFCYGKPLRYLGYKNLFTVKQLILAVLILLITFPLSGGLASFNKWIPLPMKLTNYFTKIETERASEEALLIQISSFSKYIISLIGIALLPAIFEETFFRAGLQKLFTNWFKGPFIAILITSIIFSAIHFSYYGFLVRFALGAILGTVYYYSGSIWLNILMHFLFNGIQVTMLYIYNSRNTVSKPDIETGFPIWLAIASIFILIYLFARFIKLSDKPTLLIAKRNSDDGFENWTNNTLN